MSMNTNEGVLAQAKSVLKEAAQIRSRAVEERCLLGEDIEAARRTLHEAREGRRRAQVTKGKALLSGDTSHRVGRPSASGEE